MVSQGLAGSGAPLPAFGLGLASLGNLYRPRKDSEAEDLLSAAWQAGIRYFDTAPLYGFGLSERRLGDFLAQLPRESVFVSTKVGRVLRPNPGWHEQRAYFVEAAPFEPVFDFSYDGIMHSFEASLRRLKVDYIDRVFLHDISKTPEEDTSTDHFENGMTSGYRALAELKASGLVGGIGIGANEWEICEAALEHAPFDCFLIAGRQTLLDQSASGFLTRCAREGIAVIAGGIFNSGILAADEFSTHNTRFDYNPASPDIRQKALRIAQVCAAHHVPLGAAALQFPLRHEGVSTIIPGCATKDELAQALAWQAFDIPESLWSDLASEMLIDAQQHTLGAVSS